MRREELHILLAHEKDGIGWMMSRGLLRSRNVCPKCNGEMHLQTSCKYVDGFVWRCSRNECGRPTISVRTGSLFEKSRLPLLTNVKFLYEWARGESGESVRFELGISKPTTILWGQACRDVIEFYYFHMRHDCKIGGPGKIVEIDETIVARRKYNVGRVVLQQWLFGGIVRNSVGQRVECFLELVADRTRETLHEVLQRRVLSGTFIYSDSWKAYNGLADIGFLHSKVNHSQNFVNPIDSNVHTQNIESFWSKMKRFFRKHSMKQRIHLDDYILEFLYRSEFDDVFDSLLLHFKMMLK